VRKSKNMHHGGTEKEDDLRELRVSVVKR